MKYIKKYEVVFNKSVEPKSGMYVIVKSPIWFGRKVRDFIDNNVGTIHYCYGDISSFEDDLIDVSFENIPEEIKWFFNNNISQSNLKTLNKNCILYTSDSKQELEDILAANKYNV